MAKTTRKTKTTRTRKTTAKPKARPVGGPVPRMPLTVYVDADDRLALDRVVTERRARRIASGERASARAGVDISSLVREALRQYFKAHYDRRQ